MTWPVPELRDVDKAFPADALKWIPAMAEIPAEFKDDFNEWKQLTNSWFRNGLPSTVAFHAKEGVNAESAFNAINAILRSYAPRHEHKIAATAYLCSQWFSKVENWRHDPEGET